MALSGASPLPEPWIHTRMTIKIVAFDGDDTLWHHNNFFRKASEQFHEIMNRIGDFPDAREQLDQKHINDLPVWGYGVKGLILSMIELSISMTQGTIPAPVLQEIFNVGRDTHLHPITLLDHVSETIQALHEKYQLILITKGDLIAQEMKIHKSGLEPYFDSIDIVSEKDVPTYEKIFKRMRINPEELVMIGNSLRSDVIPPVRLGAQAVHIPYVSDWHFEKEDVNEADKARFITLSTMEHLPAILENFNQSNKTLLSELSEPALLQIGRYN